MADNLNKHQKMARTGHFEGFAKGGHVGVHHPDGHRGGHKPMKEHHTGSHGGSIHDVNGSHGESTSSWDTDSIGTSGAKRGLNGGGTGGTRNRY